VPGLTSGAIRLLPVCLCGYHYRTFACRGWEKPLSWGIRVYRMELLRSAPTHQWTACYLKKAVLCGYLELVSFVPGSVLFQWMQWCILGTQPSPCFIIATCCKKHRLRLSVDACVQCAGWPDFRALSSAMGHPFSWIRCKFSSHLFLTIASQLSGITSRKWDNGVWGIESSSGQK
jgi:hypothetical protein